MSVILLLDEETGTPPVDPPPGPTGQSFTSTIVWNQTGLVGTIATQVVNSHAVLTARTTLNITEYPAGSGVYQAVVLIPPPLTGVLIVWDDGGRFDAINLEEAVAGTITVTVTPDQTVYEDPLFAWMKRRRSKLARPRALWERGFI